MSDSILDAAELEAIQSAIRESAPTTRRVQDVGIEPTRLALIADDRIADAARPVLIGLANRWGRAVPRSLRTIFPGTWQLDVIGADVIDGSTAKEELRNGWIAGMTAGASEVIVCVQGPVIDIAAARRCGAASPPIDTKRTPSPVSLKLFGPAGRAMLESLGSAWREVFEGALTPSTDLAIVARMLEARSLVRVTLTFTGVLAGRVTIYARPETIVARPQALAAHKATVAMIANALANVSVEVMVELGTLRMPLRNFKSLDRGTTHVLPRFVDSRVPVFCEGVLKAWARPIVWRGVLAVQIISVVSQQGTPTS
ncbi:MAG: FliM/FliN family flagellar motor C-terminal domain-containing protein [Proteobacteria bacterium]|nr:FliM/FliN family flagellar motor C-terminal domain-containing protein [Pseudomonadota bacterium]